MVAIKCPICETINERPNPTFVYIKCFGCGELIDVRKKFANVEDTMKAMQLMAKAGASIK